MIFEHLIIYNRYLRYISNKEYYYYYISEDDLSGRQTPTQTIFVYLHRLVAHVMLLVVPRRKGIMGIH